MKQGSHWYAKKGSNGQGIVIDEKTGANIAVAYDNAHVGLLAAAPAMLAALESIAEQADITPANPQAAMSYRLRMRDEARAAIAAAKGQP